MNRRVKFPRPEFFQKTGTSTLKVLVDFADDMFPTILKDVPNMSDDRAQWCSFFTPAYGFALSALEQLSAFKGNKRVADAYILGYYRGLQEAAFRLRPPKTSRATPRRPEGSHASERPSNLVTYIRVVSWRKATALLEVDVLSANQKSLP